MMLVRYGDRSPRVVLIQILLNRTGSNLNVDGVFGPRTRAAVVEFQTAHRIKPDGKVGPNTWRELPRGNNTKVVDVVDLGDPEVGGDAISELHRAGGNPIALGLMCAGVEQMVSSVTGQTNSPGPFGRPRAPLRHRDARIRNGDIRRSNRKEAAPWA